MVGGHLLDHRRSDDAGVVDQAVHCPETLHSLSHGLRGQFDIHDAADHCEHALRRQRRQCRVQGLGVEVDRDDVGTQRDAQFGDRLADALASAGDDQGSSGQ